jgi:hypothetical protein
MDRQKPSKNQTMLRIACGLAVIDDGACPVLTEQDDLPDL